MTNKPEVMNGESLDIAAHRRDELKQLFPGVFTETKDTDGNIVSSIDFERLKAELGTFSDIFEGRRERYGMEWPGKRDCMKVIQEPSRATLKPCPDESVDWDTTKNLFIEGDNLEVLKLLQKSYYSKVKMIYIDPPYNTGNEFIYPDNYQESLDTYLKFAGLVDDEGKKFTTNTNSDGRFHSKWMNMMYTRLYLSRNLLREDGVIFISIDDNEVSSLKCLMNDIYGEENFVGQMVWKKKYIGGKHAKHFVDLHEYVLVYAKNILELPEILMERPSGELKKFKLKDEFFEQRGKYYTRPLKSNLGLRKTLIYSIEMPDGNAIETQWMVSKDTFHQLMDDGRIVFIKKKDGTYNVHRKYYEKDGGGNVKVPSLIDEVSNADGKVELKKLFNVQEGRDIPFDNPKPTEFINYLIKPVLGRDDLILDFFAGSCSTAHALMKLNMSDNGKRRYIMVQLPEPTTEDSVAAKAGYKTITDISIDRIKRACISSKDLSQVGDYGFKVFRLKKSNLITWDSNSSQTVDQLQRNLDLVVDNIREDVGQEDILFEILLKAGFEPTESVIKLDLRGKSVYSVANGALLICLEDQLTAELIDEVITLEPMQFICLDKGFQGNDQLKANTAQVFKARSQDSGAEMVFKVV